MNENGLMNKDFLLNKKKCVLNKDDSFKCKKYEGGQNENGSKCESDSLDSITVLYSNVDSFLNKKCELLCRVDELKPSIICLTEILSRHKCSGNNNNNLTDSELQIEGYSLFRNENPFRGVVIFTENSLNARQRDLGKTDFQESVWCEFKTENKERVLIGCVYRSPNSSKENSEELHKLLKSEQFEKFDKICIVGDFNYPNINWQGLWTNKEDNDFVECLRDAFLVQKVKHPTRNRQGQKSNLLDLVLVNSDDLVSDILHQDPLGKSDHDVLVFKFYVQITKYLEDRVYKFKLNQGNYDAMRNEVRGIDWTKVLTENVENSWNSLKTIITGLMENYIPKTKCNKMRKTPLWMTKKALRIIKKKQKAYKRFIHRRKRYSYQYYLRIRNRCNRIIKKAKKNFEKKIARDCKTNPKQFWKYVQEKTKTNSGIGTLIDKDGKFAVNDLD